MPREMGLLFLLPGKFISRAASLFDFFGPPRAPAIFRPLKSNLVNFRLGELCLRRKDIFGVSEGDTKRGNCSLSQSNFFFASSLAIYYTSFVVYCVKAAAKNSFQRLLAAPRSLQDR